MWRGSADVAHPRPMRIESSTAANSTAIRRRCPCPQIRVDDDDRYCGEPQPFTASSRSDR